MREMWTNAKNACASFFGGKHCCEDGKVDEYDNEYENESKPLLGTTFSDDCHSNSGDDGSRTDTDTEGGSGIVSPPRPRPLLARRHESHARLLTNVYNKFCEEGFVYGADKRMPPAPVETFLAYFATYMHFMLDAETQHGVVSALSESARDGVLEDVLECVARDAPNPPGTHESGGGLRGAAVSPLLLRMNEMRLAAASHDNICEQ